MIGIHCLEYSPNEYAPLFKHQSETSARSHIE